MVDVPHRESGTKYGYVDLLMMMCLLCVPASTSCFKFEVSPAMSWWKARRYCQINSTGDLYIPEIEEVLNVSISNPPSSTFYWVGAMEILQWNWTDNSSSFKRIGYKSSNNIRVKANLPGNSVEKCYRNCSNDASIGLSETRCYCLGKHPELSVNTSAYDEHSCPGNFKEKCGNASGMSIYKTDTAFSDSKKGDCVTAFLNKKRGLNDVFTLHFETDNCEAIKYAVCSENNTDVHQNSNKGRCQYDLCETCFRASWINASTTCNLVKVTHDNKEDIFNLLPNKTTHYWIGLKRKKAQMWIDGKEVKPDYEGNGTGSPRCLALYNDAHWTPYWIPCNEDHQALCGSDTINSETTSTEQREISTHSIMTAETTSAEKAENSIHPMMTAGLYVGSGLGVFMLLCLLAAVIVVLKRKEASRTRGETENPTIISDAQERDVAQCTSSTAQAHPNNPDTVLGVYSKVTKTKSKSVTIHDENGANETCIRHSNKDVDEDDTYNRAGQFKSVESEVVENCYSHLKADVENDYDIAGRKPEIEPLDDTYNHLGATGVDQESEEVEYRYSHMKADEQNEYDIAGGKQEDDRLDDTYNHLDAMEANMEANNDMAMKEYKTLNCN